MTQRLAFLLLVVALVSSGASAPFAHVHPPDRHDHGPTPIQIHSHSSDHDHDHNGDDAHWHITGQETHSADNLQRFGSHQGLAVALGESGRHVSVALAAVAVERPTASADAAPSLVRSRQAGIKPDQRGRHLSAQLSHLPNPPPRVGQSTRAPPA